MAKSKNTKPVNTTTTVKPATTGVKATVKGQQSTAGNNPAWNRPASGNYGSGSAYSKDDSNC